MGHCKIPRITGMLHGADYSPEQWLDMPHILEKDIELMKKAGFNCVSVGIFSWSSLEPQEGIFTFEWLDEVVDNLYKNGIYTVMATPTASKPHWMSTKYPEILRVARDGRRDHLGGRHNHCYSSPVYRNKTRIINTEIAKRYANNPAVILWHVSNEIQGECFCENCCKEFHRWLENKYKDIDVLNKQWWTTFWSHRYSSWHEIEPPFDNGDPCLHGLELDWRRFCTDMQVDFLREEIRPLKSVNPDIPTSINMMGLFDGINYFKFRDVIDIVSWDSYPQWHNNSLDETGNAMWNAAAHDMMRSIKDQPFLLMENTPSTANWCPVSKQKRPGFNKASALQAIAHGSDSVQYFQWRASRGGAEKFHSAVVMHNLMENSRIFREVSVVGDMLSKLQRVQGTTVNAEIAIINDTENRWAVSECKGPRNQDMGNMDAMYSVYKTLWEQGIAVDIIDMESPIDKYKIIVAPMLYMLRNNIADRLKKFTKDGGILISTCFTGVVNENDLCYLGEIPAEGLSDVFGIYSEEIDALYNHDKNSIVIDIPDYDLNGEYYVQKLCEVIHLKTAEALGYFRNDYYKGMPAFTRNTYGKGTAYYIAAGVEYDFFRPFITSLCKKHGIKKALETELPYGVSITKRSNGDESFWFIMNFLDKDNFLKIPFPLKNMITGGLLEDEIVLKPYDAIPCEKV